ncbi:PLP-dependent aminotransferase family protein [Dasania marina]|uniref:MocR-like pyridoxine biosynthesis transcription factor PdxR n=1 Tax=Dasania marina TaxID=471499 RepID=UPI0030DD02E0|tara:strand:- start:45892 stop:47694 length:1803 start_codon:yes stop_codon:yes gene_type:complete
MKEILIYLDPNSALSLQAQIREKLVEAIISGVLPGDERLPPTRKLAEMLKVSRNTVILAYQKLTDEGYLESRPRSGIYVSNKIISDINSAALTDKPISPKQIIKRGKGVDFKQYDRPLNEYTYPFIHDCIDTDLIPTSDWQEASRLAHSSNAAKKWSSTDFEEDDPEFIDQLRTKILARRAITASPEEILITTGAHNAHYLITQLLVDADSRIAFEDPGAPKLRNMLKSSGATLHYQPIDDSGMIIDDNIDSCQLLYCTPSHQVPTGVCMTLERRKAAIAKANQQNITIIEDDVDSDSNYEGQEFPALRSLDTQGRVIYVSQLSTILAPGLNLGFIVASPPIIAQLKALRKKIMPPPSLLQQRTACTFFKLGHYNASLANIKHVLYQRWKALWKALNYHFPFLIITAPSQGGACWVTIKKDIDIDIDALVARAKLAGVLIEPGNIYYSDPSTQEKTLRIGTAGVPIDRIRPGINKLGNLLREMTSNYQGVLTCNATSWISGDKLSTLMPGAMLKMKTVFGNSCHIQLHSDGTMSGVAELDKLETDKGRWWIEGDLWYRQWSTWSYGEALGLKIAITGKNIQWYSQDNMLEDRGEIILAKQ